jgi:tellurite methyltransferase
VLRAITSFHQDERGDWVATLSCGHGQHVRHKPPFIERPWVMSAEGRQSHVGVLLACALCAADGQSHGEGMANLKIK